MSASFPFPSWIADALLAARSHAASQAGDAGPGWEIVAAAVLLGLAVGFALGFLAARRITPRGGPPADRPSRTRRRSWETSSSGDNPDGDSSRRRSWEAAATATTEADPPPRPADPASNPASNPPAPKAQDTSPPSAENSPRRRSWES